MTGLPLLVIDASAALALVLADEEGEDVAALVRDVVDRNGQLLVPSLFWYEMGNGILTALRRGRVDEHAWQEASSLMGRLPFVTDPEQDDAARTRVWSLARTHELTYYDAAYLELARRMRCRLKTFDKHILALKSRYAFIQ